jgi:DNA-binding NtrC family response regulator
MSLEEIEQEVISQTLERTGGNVKKTAQILKMHRPTLYRKLKRMNYQLREKPDESADESADDE